MFVPARDIVDAQKCMKCADLGGLSVLVSPLLDQNPEEMQSSSHSESCITIRSRHQCVGTRALF